MKFDYCIGNPPYQVLDGGAQASAKPVYQYFSETAKDIATVNCFVQPSRWMTGGKGLDDYRNTMIHDKHVKLLHDYADSKEVFANVDIKGGVCVYIRNEHYEGDCKCIRHDSYGITESIRPLCDGTDSIFIREPMLVTIKNKVDLSNGSIEDIASPRKPYGFRGDIFKNESKYGLPKMSNIPIKDGYTVLGLDGLKRVNRYVDKNYPFPKKQNLNKYKLFVTRNYGCGEIGEIPATPVLATPTMACTETFIEIGSFDTQEELNNLYHYFCTKFFRAMVGVRKQDQGAARQVYHYVPLQDFTSNSDIDWTQSIANIDKQLYKKYNLSKEEIDFIETHVKEMN